MATERWDDNRLDRLADSVAANTEAISQLIGVIQNQQDSINEAFETSLRTNNELFEANTRVLQKIVEEIRGLRAENHRILTHLFGEQESE